MQILRFAKCSNPDIQIWFHEDGLAAYNGRKNWLYRTAPNVSFAARVRNLLHYGVMSYTQRKRVKGIYLYQSELSNLKQIPIVKLPAITKEENPVCYQVCEASYVAGEDLYSDCRVIYMVEPPKTHGVNLMEEIYDILDCLTQLMPPAQIVVKPHPVMNSVELEFDAARYPGLKIEMRSCAIETLLQKCFIDDKIVIIGNSTCGLYLHWVYGKTPYVILTTRLRQSNQLLLDYVGRFMEQYPLQKAFAPTDIEGLRKVLEQIIVNKQNIGGN